MSNFSARRTVGGKVWMDVFCEPFTVGKVRGETFCSCRVPDSHPLPPSRFPLFTACPPGQFAPGPGSSECQPCGPGTTSAGNGATTCDPCPPNTFTNGPGSTQCLGTRFSRAVLFSASRAFFCFLWWLPTGVLHRQSSVFRLGNPIMSRDLFGLRMIGILICW